MSNLRKKITQYVFFLVDSDKKKKSRKILSWSNFDVRAPKKKNFRMRFSRIYAKMFIQT